MKTRISLRYLALVAAALSFLAPASANALEASCKTFDKILSRDGKYDGAATLDAHLGSSGFQGGFAYTDTERNSLFVLSTIDNEAGYYLVGLQLYPQIQVRAIAHSEIRPKEYPEEIAKFLSGLTMIRPDRWKGDDPINPAPYEQCNRLVGTIQGDLFEDGKARLFLRHYTFGHRTFTTKICDGMHQEQLNFYEAFSPQIYTLKHVRVPLDSAYAGVQKGSEFEYPCGLNQLVSAREKAFDSSVYATKSPGTAPLFEYLKSQSLVTDDEADFNRHTKERWEFNTLRNLVEGHKIYGK